MLRGLSKRTSVRLRQPGEPMQVDISVAYQTGVDLSHRSGASAWLTPTVNNNAADLMVRINAGAANCEPVLYCASGVVGALTASS